MQITKENLDTSFSELIKGVTNLETPRQFIKDSEKQFGMKAADLDNMSDESLNSYIEFLDYLWLK